MYTICWIKSQEESVGKFPMRRRKINDFEKRYSMNVERTIIF